MTITVYVYDGERKLEPFTAPTIAKATDQALTTKTPSPAWFAYIAQTVKDTTHYYTIDNAGKRTESLTGRDTYLALDKPTQEVVMENQTVVEVKHEDPAGNVVAVSPLVLSRDQATYIEFDYIDGFERPSHRKGVVTWLGEEYLHPVTKAKQQKARLLVTLRPEDPESKRHPYGWRTFMVGNMSKITVANPVEKDDPNFAVLLHTADLHAVLAAK